MTTHHRSDMRPLRYDALPLLGSNQDSPDPEEVTVSEMPLDSGPVRANFRDPSPERGDSTVVAPAQDTHSGDGSHGLSHGQLSDVKHQQCDTCPAESRWLLTLDCPLAATPDCWLCTGTGTIHVCPSCFYLGPDRNGLYGGGVE